MLFIIEAQHLQFVLVRWLRRKRGTPYGLQHLDPNKSVVILRRAGLVRFPTRFLNPQTNQPKRAPLQSKGDSLFPGDLEHCPDTNPAYQYYRGYCYQLTAWALRHYDSNLGKYDFTETWQQSADYCVTENGTLLTIKDEDEAYFIKVCTAIRRDLPF